LFEYASAVFSGAASDAFLGTQGDPWDTQKDMLTALIGASAAILTLSRVHDHQISKMEQR
jgi:putative membrane protein